MPPLRRLPDCPRDPASRDGGLTHVLDKGLSPRDIEGMFDVGGEFIDIVKLGWGTATSRTTSPKKIDALPR